jgi:uncharacterized phage protein (TIGR02220 family)
MKKILRLMDPLPQVSKQMIAFELHRIYGGPLTGAMRSAMYRERHAAVTEDEPPDRNESVTPERNGAPFTGQYDLDSSSSLKAENQLLREQAKEVLAFLNQKANRSYRFIDANLDIIAARLKTGATVSDCKAVIARKTRDWATDPHMREYLRPETLFGKTKFEGYLGLAEPTNV